MGDSAPIASPTSVHFVTPPPTMSPFVAAKYRGEALRFCTVVDFVNNASPPGLANRELDDLELHLGSVKEQPSFAAAKEDECWRAAMLEEMASIEENSPWELVDPLIGCHPVGLKWVFKVKGEEHGAVVRHKARLVAKGFVQREGIDIEEVFTPVVVRATAPHAGDGEELERPLSAHEVRVPQRGACRGCLCAVAVRLRHHR